MSDTQEYIGIEVVKVVGGDARLVHIEPLTSNHMHSISRKDFEEQFQSTTSSEMDFSMAMYWILHGDGRRVGRKSAEGDSFGMRLNFLSNPTAMVYFKDGGCNPWRPSQEDMFATDYYVIE